MTSTTVGPTTGGGSTTYYPQPYSHDWWDNSSTWNFVSNMASVAYTHVTGWMLVYMALLLIHCILVMFSGTYWSVLRKWFDSVASFLTLPLTIAISIMVFIWPTSPGSVVVCIIYSLLALILLAYWFYKSFCLYRRVNCWLAWLPGVNAFFYTAWSGGFSCIPHNNAYPTITLVSKGGYLWLNSTRLGFCSAANMPENCVITGCSQSVVYTRIYHKVLSNGVGVACYIKSRSVVNSMLQLHSTTSVDVLTKLTV